MKGWPHIRSWEWGWGTDLRALDIRSTRAHVQCGMLLTTCISMRALVQPNEPRVDDWCEVLAVSMSTKQGMTKAYLRWIGLTRLFIASNRSQIELDKITWINLKIKCLSKNAFFDLRPFRLHTKCELSAAFTHLTPALNSGSCTHSVNYR